MDKHLTKKKKDAEEKRPKEINQKWKKRNNNWHQKNRKGFKKILWTTICPKTGQPGLNG